MICRKIPGESPLRATACIWVLLSACRAARSDPATDGDRPPRRLEPPAEFPAAFPGIRAFMALPDGRLVVSEPAGNRLSLIDFPRGASQPLGRVGQGPREFRRPGGLYRGRGGGVSILDQDLRRLLPVSPSGRLEEVIGLPTGGAAGSWSARGPDPLWVDSLGHTYASIRFGGFTATTSVLLRYVPGARTDTVTRLQRPITKALQAGGSGAGEYQDVRFSPEDAGPGAPTGRRAAVPLSGPAPYRVDGIPPAGPAVTGPAISHQAIRISQAEKEFIASGAGGLRGRISVTDRKSTRL